jgi:hypothetical protein
MMSKFGRLKKSTRIAPGTAICCDCGMDTMPCPSRPGTLEQFIVKDTVWSAAGMPAGKIDPRNHELVGGGFLCVGCIEARLGRRLTIDDFNPLTVPLLLGDPYCTKRLRSRALYRTQAEEDAAKVAPPIKWRADFCPDGFAIATTIEVPEAETICCRPMQQQAADTLLKHETS